MFTAVRNNYGYGWFVDERFGRKRTWRGGAVNSFAAMIMRYPADGVPVIALSNIENAGAVKTAQAPSVLVFGAAEPK